MGSADRNIFQNNFLGFTLSNQKVRRFNSSTSYCNKQRTNWMIYCTLFINELLNNRFTFMFRKSIPTNGQQYGSSGNHSLYKRRNSHYNDKWKRWLTPLNMKVFHHINLSPRRAPSIGVPTSDPNAANANARPIRNLVKTFRGSKYEL